MTRRPEINLVTIGAGRGLGIDREREIGAILGDPGTPADRRIEARNELAAGNLMLVVAVANRVASHLSLPNTDDLVGDGFLGLLDAADRFDVRREARFSTFAVPVIRWAILRGLRRGRPAIPVSQLGDDDARSPVEAVDPAPPPDQAVAAADLRRAVREEVDRLGGAGRDVVALRYGLDGEDRLGGPEVGRRLGVSRQYVHQLESGALERLRPRLMRRLGARGGGDVA